MRDRLRRLQTFELHDDAEPRDREAFSRVILVNHLDSLPDVIQWFLDYDGKPLGTLTLTRRP